MNIISLIKENLEHFLYDADPRVREEALQHKDITHEHLSNALNDPDPIVRGEANEVLAREGRGRYYY